MAEGVFKTSTFVFDHLVCRVTSQADIPRREGRRIQSGVLAIPVEFHRPRNPMITPGRVPGGDCLSCWFRRCVALSTCWDGGRREEAILLHFSGASSHSHHAIASLMKACQSSTSLLLNNARFQNLAYIQIAQNRSPPQMTATGLQLRCSENRETGVHPCISSLLVYWNHVPVAFGFVGLACVLRTRDQQQPPD